MEVTVTSSNFEKEVLNSKVPVLVDFWAAWCGPCKMISPHIKSIAKEWEGKLKVCKINVDDAQDIATTYTVMSIPSLMIFKEGKVLEKRVGVMSKKDLDKFIYPLVH